MDVSTLHHKIWRHLLTADVRDGGRREDAPSGPAGPAEASSTSEARSLLHEVASALAKLDAQRIEAAMDPLQLVVWVGEGSIGQASDAASSSSSSSSSSSFLSIHRIQEHISNKQMLLDLVAGSYDMYDAVSEVIVAVIANQLLSLSSSSSDNHNRNVLPMSVVMDTVTDLVRLLSKLVSMNTLATPPVPRDSQFTDDGGQHQHLRQHNHHLLWSILMVVEVILSSVPDNRQQVEALLLDYLFPSQLAIATTIIAQNMSIEKDVSNSDVDGNVNATTKRLIEQKWLPHTMQLRQWPNPSIQLSFLHLHLYIALVHSVLSMSTQDILSVPKRASMTVRGLQDWLFIAQVLLSQQRHASTQSSLGLVSMISYILSGEKTPDNSSLADLTSQLARSIPPLPRIAPLATGEAEGLAVNMLHCLASVAFDAPEAVDDDGDKVSALAKATLSRIARLASPGPAHVEENQYVFLRAVGNRWLRSMCERAGLLTSTPNENSDTAASIDLERLRALCYHYPKEHSEVLQLWDIEESAHVVGSVVVLLSQQPRLFASVGRSYLVAISGLLSTSQILERVLPIAINKTGVQVLLGISKQQTESDDTRHRLDGEDLYARHGSTWHNIWRCIQILVENCSAADWFRSSPTSSLPAVMMMMADAARVPSWVVDALQEEKGADDRSMETKSRANQYRETVLVVASIAHHILDASVPTPSSSLSTTDSANSGHDLALPLDKTSGCYHEFIVMLTRFAAWSAIPELATKPLQLHSAKVGLKCIHWNYLVRLSSCDKVDDDDSDNDKVRWADSALTVLNDVLCVILPSNRRAKHVQHKHVLSVNMGRESDNDEENSFWASSTAELKARVTASVLASSIEQALSSTLPIATPATPTETISPWTTALAHSQNLPSQSPPSSLSSITAVTQFLSVCTQMSECILGNSSDTRVKLITIHSIRKLSEVGTVWGNEAIYTHQPSLWKLRCRLIDAVAHQLCFREDILLQQTIPLLTTMVTSFSASSTGVRVATSSSEVESAKEMERECLIRLQKTILYELNFLENPKQLRMYITHPDLFARVWARADAAWTAEKLLHRLMTILDFKDHQLVRGALTVLGNVCKECWAGVRTLHIGAALLSALVFVFIDNLPLSSTGGGDTLSDTNMDIVGLCSELYKLHIISEEDVATVLPSPASSGTHESNDVLLPLRQQLQPRGTEEKLPQPIVEFASSQSVIALDPKPAVVESTTTVSASSLTDEGSASSLKPISLKQLGSIVPESALLSSASSSSSSSLFRSNNTKSFTSRPRPSIQVIGED
jgi:hypothetical protein